MKVRLGTLNITSNDLLAKCYSHPCGIGFCLRGLHNQVKMVPTKGPNNGFVNWKLRFPPGYTDFFMPLYQWQKRSSCVGWCN